MKNLGKLEKSKTEIKNEDFGGYKCRNVIADGKQ